MKQLLLIPVLGIGMLSSAVANPTIIEKVNEKAQKYDIPGNFAQAVIKTESKYNPKVRGSRGEIGLGQILCPTAKGVGFKGKCDQLYHPDINLEYSMKYLKLALDKANGNQCHAATLYAGGLDRKPRSSAYCKKVMANKID